MSRRKSSFAGGLLAPAQAKRKEGTGGMSGFAKLSAINDKAAARGRLDTGVYSTSTNESRVGA